MASTAEAIFFALHSGLPREGPGNFESTSRAVALLEGLPASPRVLDLGCGPGMQTLHLAQLLPGGRITGIEKHPPYVEEARRRIHAAGIDQRVDCRVGDMADVDEPDGSVDLIWCEGAAYIIGIEQALSRWRRLLAPGGMIALTDASFLTSPVPDKVTEFWRAYPDMQDVPTRRRQIAALGYELLGDFALPEAAWWDDYYTPLQANLDRLRREYPDDPVAREILDVEAEEMALYRAYADAYGYVFYVMKAAESPR